MTITISNNSLENRIVYSKEVFSGAYEEAFIIDGTVTSVNRCVPRESLAMMIRRSKEAGLCVHVSKGKRKCLHTRTKKCAKALYLIGSLAQMYVYLDALVEMGAMSEEQENRLVDEIITECGPITMGEIRELRNRF